MYLIFVVYIANNIISRTQFRSLRFALIAGLLIAATSIIIFFSLGLGSEFNLFSDILYGNSETGTGTLTVSEEGTGKTLARSSGFFKHPAHAAYYLEYILPIMLLGTLAAQSIRERLFIGAVFLTGVAALILTFSRSGMVGFLVATTILLPIARWSQLISRRLFAWIIVIAVLAAAASTPLLIDFLQSRPEAFSLRWTLVERSVDTFLERPFSGVGLNNSSAATEGSRIKVGDKYQTNIVHNHYLIVLVEVGIIGFFLFCGFFSLVIVTALRHLSTATTEAKVILGGIVAALTGIAFHNLADPFGGHSTQTMLWLYVGVIFAVCHQTSTSPRPEAVVCGTRNSGSSGAKL